MEECVEGVVEGCVEGVAEWCVEEEAEWCVEGRVEGKEVASGGWRGKVEGEAPDSGAITR